MVIGVLLWVLVWVWCVGVGCGCLLFYVGFVFEFRFRCWSERGGVTVLVLGMSFNVHVNRLKHKKLDKHIHM